VVTRLDQRQVAAGRERVVRWSGMGDSGERAASGIYFVRVATPYEISTVKIVKLE
jgi:hypothetical protein